MRLFKIKLTKQFYCLLILSIAPFLMSTSASSDQRPSEEVSTVKSLKYFGSIDRKLKAILLGANEEFEQAFRRSDQHKIFVHDNPPQLLDDTDVLVILLNNWNDISILDDNLNFAKIQVKDMIDTDFKSFSVYQIQDRYQRIRKLMVTVYNISALGEKSYECYANDILNEVLKKEDRNPDISIVNCE